MTELDTVSLTGEYTPRQRQELEEGLVVSSIYLGFAGGCLSGLGINHLARNHIIDNGRYEHSKGSADDVEKAHQIYREIGKELGVCTGYGTPDEHCYSYGNAFIDKTPEQALQKLGDIEGIFSRNKEFLIQGEHFPEAQMSLHQVTTYIENNFQGDWPRNAHNWYAWLYSGGGRGGRYHHVVLGEELRTFLAVTEDSKHELTYLTSYANTSDASTIASFVIGGILSGVIIGMVSCSILKKIARSIRLKPRVNF